MNIHVSLTEKNVTLVLRDGEKSLDERQWTDENDLLERFFPTLEEMLQSNQVDITDVDKFLLETNIPQGYTTARIARTIVKVLNFARQSEV